VLRCRADGFFGFYSTQASPALEFYLTELKKQSQIKDFRILDSKFLESYLTTPGFAKVASRYFPLYAQTHPLLHLIENEYLPILCEHCKKDLLQTLFTEEQQGVVVRLRRQQESPDAIEVIANIYYACKGSCDAELQNSYCTGTLLSTAGWSALSDLITTQGFLGRTLTLLRQIGTDEIVYTTQALEKETYLLKALSQIVIRE
jgi:hypothetical protein